MTVDAGAGATYLWSTGSKQVSANITATAAATYTVGAITPTINAISCSSSGSVVVSLYPTPTVQIVSTRTTICKGEKTLLTASGGTSYVWTNQTPTTASIIVTPTLVNLTTTYTVTGTDANGCQGVATKGVKVITCPGINELNKEESFVEIYPNPNSGAFTIQVKSDMQLSLINELGQVIQELNFSEENQYQQKIQGLSSGIYFIKGVHNGSSIMNKLVVTK